MDVERNDLMVNVMTNVVEDSVKGAWEKVKKFFVDLNATDSIRYGTAYEEYLRNTRHKNSKIKTIIYRRAPKDLYSFYECIGVRYNGQTIDTNSVRNLIKHGNKIIITGTGGIGKSILFKHLFLNTAVDTQFIPVLIELRSFNVVETKEISLYDAIYQSLTNNGFGLAEEYFEYSMKKGAYIIFLDGYDEVNKEKKVKVASEVKHLTEKFKDNKFLISSRPTDEFIGWNDFAEMVSLSLTKEQALNLIQKIEFDEVAKQTFYQELESNLYEKYKSFASNPLLLNIMLLTFQKHASIPERLNDFYEEAFVTLYNVHDATKDAYVRDIRSDLGCEDFKLVFAYICFKSYFKEEYEFSEAKLREYIQMAKEKFDRIHFSVEDFQEDLTMSVCMLVKEGINYRFSHRSFQEYFAAWYTCKLLDDVQAKLLANWIKESHLVFVDSYFEMLFDLQGEKVNRIVLLPALKQVVELYNKKGFCIDFLRELFKEVQTERISNKVGEAKCKISLGIGNRYLCYCMMLSNKLNNYPYPEIGIEVEQREQELCKKMLENRKRKEKQRRLPSRQKWSFEEVLEVATEQELLEVLRWFEHQVQFSSSIIEKYNDSNPARKRKVASIIDEL